VTVTVPNKDHGRYLPAALESILAQDYPALECIVVDAASTDGSLDILRAYEARGVRWLSEPDSGPWEAIEKGWRLGRGEILAWLNADDTWQPGAVRAAVSYLETHAEVAVVHGDCGLIDEDGKLVDLVRARAWDTVRAVRECDHILMQPASFMRRSAVEAAGGLAPRWTHDQELWLRIALAGGRIEAISEHLGNTRIGDGHAHTIPGLILPARLAMMDRLFATPGLPAEIRAVERRALSNTYLRTIDPLKPKRLGDWRWAARCLWGALRTDPANAPYIADHVLRLAGARSPLGGRVAGALRRMAALRP
jgi:hypothetical protein